MKSISYALLFLLSVSSATLGAQNSDFAPVGAKWYYSELNFALKIVPHTVESVGKESYEGKWCSKLVSSSYDILANPAYIYTENDTVYYFNPLSNQFEVLYNFTASVGDFWTFTGFPGVLDTIKVDSISSMVVNGDTLKVWNVSTSIGIEWGRRIMAKVGNDQLFLPKYALVEAYVWGLRCFESPNEDYSFVSYPCDTTYSTVSQTNAPNEDLGIQISPNPFYEALHLYISSPSESHTFLLFDSYGRLVRRQNFSGSIEVGTASLPSGLYFWRVERGEELVRMGKCVKG